MGLLRFWTCFVPCPRLSSPHPQPPSPMAPLTRSKAKSHAFSSPPQFIPSQIAPLDSPSQPHPLAIAFPDATPDLGPAAQLGSQPSATPELGPSHFKTAASLSKPAEVESSADQLDCAHRSDDQLAVVDDPVPIIKGVVAKFQDKRKANCNARREGILTRSGKRLRAATISTIKGEHGLAMLSAIKKGDEAAAVAGVKEIPSARDVCRICKSTNPVNLMRTHCRHEFCLQCIQGNVANVLRGQLETVVPSFQNLSTPFFCPETRCKSELSQEELTAILGVNVMKYYKNWLAKTYDALYRPSINKDSRIVCVACNSDKTGPTAVLATKLSNLSHDEVCCALEVRGFEKKYLKQSCVKLLLNAVGMDGINSNKPCWICTKCDTAWCGACGMKISSSKQKNQGNGHKFCKEQKNYEIYRHIVELEDAFKRYDAGSAIHEKRQVGANSNNENIWATGTGFGGACFNPSKNLMDNAKAAEVEVDSCVEKILGFLTDLLNKGMDAQGDQSPTQSLAAYTLLCSGNILSQLLQQLAMNDSMLDISSRGSLYLRFINFLKALTLHAELLPILIGCDKKQDKEVKGEDWVFQLLGLKRSNSNKGKIVEVELGGDISVIKGMGNIYKQAKIMLQRLQSDTGKKIQHVDINLAKELCKCYEDLDDIVFRNKISKPCEDSNLCVSAKSKDMMLDEEEKDQKIRKAVVLYKERLKPMQFKVMNMTDDEGNYRHYFKDLIKGKGSDKECIDKRGVHNQKRMLRISKEIASISTSLPLEWESSIHLCVDEVRMDALRAVIIGPCGTPYQNGVFVFDLFLPADYPQVPPSVQFLTTGGGTVRFNPNLYSTGKVCLSLLGTWSGPGWIPEKSTLLQVLVSIQSLIFVKDPYYNEPGLEVQVSPEAEKENERHRVNTLSIAVLGALQRPDPFFEDMIREHFCSKKEELEHQCDEWLAAISDSPKKERMSKIVKQIKDELKKL